MQSQFVPENAQNQPFKAPNPAKSGSDFAGRLEAARTLYRRFLGLCGDAGWTAKAERALAYCDHLEHVFAPHVR